MLNDVFAAEILKLPQNLKSRENYERAVSELGWRVLDWQEDQSSPHSPVKIKIETATGQQKDFLILRSGNSITFAVVKEINGEPHVLVRSEAKGTGVNIVTMPSGYMNAQDRDIGDTALRKLFEEAGMSVSGYIPVRNSAAALSNNSTNTSTSFIVEVDEDSATPKGWRYIPLEEAPSLINHLPSQQAAYAACAHKRIIPLI